MDEKSLFMVHKKNEEWFSSRYDELKEQYSGKFIGVKGPDNIFVEDNIEELVGVIEGEGININEVFISPIPPKGVAAIL